MDDLYNSREEEKELEQALQVLKKREQLSDKEVSSWLSAKKHLRSIDAAALFSRLLSPYRTEEQVDAAWKRLHRDIRGKRNTGLRWMGAAASVLLAVGFFLFFFYNPENTPEPGEKSRPIEPGKIMAELISSDGQQFTLSRDNRYLGTIESTSIRSDSLAGIIYQAATAPQTAETTISHTLRVPPGGFYPLTLSDGTKVWLNADSELSYPVSFPREKREVFLKGEGYFEVSTDPFRPFVVRTPHADVSVLGTVFNISAYEEDETTLTTLLEGSVAFRSGKSGEQIILKPGEQGVLTRGTGKITTREVDAKAFTSWTDGLFNFKDMKLEGIMRILSRWYQIEVIYIQPELKEDIYNGKFPMYSGIEEALDIIEISEGGARFVIEGNTIVVYEK